MSDQVAVAMAFSHERLFARSFCARTIRLVQIVAVFPFTFCEWLATDVAEQIGFVPFAETSPLHLVDEQADVAWVGGRQIGLGYFPKLVPGVVIVRVVTAEEASLKVHHLGLEPLAVVQGGADLRLHIGQGHPAHVSEHGLPI